MSNELVHLFFVLKKCSSIIWCWYLIISLGNPTSSDWVVAKSFFWTFHRCSLRQNYVIILSDWLNIELLLALIDNLEKSVWSIFLVICLLLWCLNKLHSIIRMLWYSDAFLFQIIAGVADWLFGGWCCLLLIGSILRDIIVVRAFDLLEIQMWCLIGQNDRVFGNLEGIFWLVR